MINDLQGLEAASVMQNKETKGLGITDTAELSADLYGLSKKRFCMIVKLSYSSKLHRNNPPESIKMNRRRAHCSHKRCDIF